MNSKASYKLQISTISQRYFYLSAFKCEKTGKDVDFSQVLLSFQKFTRILILAYSGQHLNLTLSLPSSSNRFSRDSAHIS